RSGSARIRTSSPCITTTDLDDGGEIVLWRRRARRLRPVLYKEAKAMSHSAPIDVDGTSPPFDQFSSIHRLAAARSGHAPGEHARHQLYVARDKRSRANVLVKITSKPGLVYEQELTNEIASLSTINRELPDSRYFPVLWDHGRLPDSRTYLVMSLFDEWPVATSIGSE